MSKAGGGMGGRVYEDGKSYVLVMLVIALLFGAPLALALNSAIFNVIGDLFVGIVQGIQHAAGVIGAANLGGGTIVTPDAAGAAAAGAGS